MTSLEEVVVLGLQALALLRKVVDMLVQVFNLKFYDYYFFFNLQTLKLFLFVIFQNNVQKNNRIFYSG